MKKRTARIMKCHVCKANLTATMQTVTRMMGKQGERTFEALKAPFRVEVTIRNPAEIPNLQTYVFCETCKDVPRDALAFVKMQRDERHPDPNVERASETPFIIY